MYFKRCNQWKLTFIIIRETSRYFHKIVNLSLNMLVVLDTKKGLGTALPPWWEISALNDQIKETTSIFEIYSIASGDDEEQVWSHYHFIRKSSHKFHCIYFRSFCPHLSPVLLNHQKEMLVDFHHQHSRNPSKESCWKTTPNYPQYAKRCQTPSNCTVVQSLVSDNFVFIMLNILLYV